MEKAYCAIFISILQSALFFKYVSLIASICLSNKKMRYRSRTGLVSSLRYSAIWVLQSAERNNELGVAPFGAVNVTTMR